MLLVTGDKNLFHFKIFFSLIIVLEVNLYQLTLDCYACHNWRTR